MSHELRGYLGEEVQQGGITLRRLYYTCPQHGKDCPSSYGSIPVTLGPHTSIKRYEGDVKPYPVWNYKMEGNLIVVSPSIEAKGECTYHAFYKFIEVKSKEEL